MNHRHLLPPQARHQTLRFALAGLWLAQLALLVWLWTRLYAQGSGGLAAGLTLLLGWLLLQWSLVVLGFGLKWWIGDWSPAVRGPVAQWARTLATEIWWMTRFYLIEQAWRPAAMHLADADTRVPLLLVHGFLCNGAVWNPLAASLREQGRSFASVSLEPSYRDFEQQLIDLDAAVSSWLTVTESQRVILIGHSMGGLLVRAYAERHPARCAGVICVAAPHHGTYLGDCFYGLEGGPPSPRCRWLQAFNTRSDERIGVPALNLWSADDNIVLPAISAQLARTPEQALHGHGHMALVATAQARAALLRGLHEIESSSEQSK